MKKVMVVTLVLGCFAFAAVAYAEAAPAGGGGGAQKATRLDKNGDGVVSKDEWPGRAETFSKADSNGDGVLDSVEMAASREKLQERRKGPEGAQKGPMGDDERLRERMRGIAQFGAALFMGIDVDHDGKLSMAEIDEFAGKIKAADTDKDGFVSKEEIRTAFSERIIMGVGEAFMKKYDKDHDGKVTKEEFAGEDARFKWADANADGVVTMDDFKIRAKEAPERREGLEKGGRRREGAEKGEGSEMGPHRRRDRASGEETPAVTPPAVTPPVATPANTPQEGSKKPAQ
jgi:hypothetical protein